jgi:bacillithiol system protein YtxJ
VSIANLESPEQLDALLEQSHQAPVLIFKHSSTCPVSAGAFAELRSFLDACEAPCRVGVVVVQTARGVSNAIAANLAVPHESPQALLVRDGVVTWSASHLAITRRALAEAVGGLATS